MKLWQILVLVGLGLAYGLIQPGRFTYALGHATLYIFLPALLFEAAWNLNYKAVFRNWLAIATLAGPGVVVTALIVAGILTIVRVPFGSAFLTGAILSATDPIAVVAIFRRLKIPQTLVAIVESESLFNDAVAVALYRGALLALALGVPNVGAIARLLSYTVLGAVAAVALGIALAFVTARMLRGTRAVPLQIVATILCAYGAYFAADYLHLPGIFATIASGMALRYNERKWITLRIAEEVNGFWDIAALLANALVFFMVGAALGLDHVLREPIFVIACLGAIYVARNVVAGLLLPSGYPREWIDVVRVTSMRGALSIALALALPSSVPYRGAIVDATFAVALVTLAAGSFTVAPAIKRAARIRA